MQNPLTEATSTSLLEIFEKNPLELTDSDVERIVTEYRSQRKLWVEKESKPKKQAAPTTLNLLDLDIKL